MQHELVTVFHALPTCEEIAFAGLGGNVPLHLVPMGIR